MSTHSLFWLLVLSYCVFSVGVYFIFFFPLFWSLVCLVLLVLTVSLFVSRRISKPLHALQDIADRVASGIFQNQFPWSESEEILGLTRSMQTMAKQLEERFTTIVLERNQKDVILSSMSDGVILIDSNQHIVAINAFAARIIDMRADQLIGTHVTSVLRNSDFTLFVQSLILGVTIPDSTFIEYASIPFQVQGTCFYDTQGVKTGALIMLHDLSMVKHLETIRKDFVSNVSHELKTPITLIQGCLETLETEGLSDSHRDQFLNMASLHAKRLNHIVDDLLMLARLEQSHTRIEVHPYSVKRLFDDALSVLNPLIKEMSILVEFDVDPELSVTCNQSLITYALTNVIKNSIQHAQTTRLKCTAVVHPGQIELTVQDFGSGISPEHLDRLFERFYRVDMARSSDQGNTGLGLALVKHIIQAHGGTVSVESDLSKGSIFRLFLPKLEQEAV